MSAFPVICPQCRAFIGSKYRLIDALRAPLDTKRNYASPIIIQPMNDEAIGVLLDEWNITNMCCRTVFICHVNQCQYRY